MKNGFTLIELLAVIVILAIIALIATPIVLGIINDSKNSATIRSAEFYVGAVKNAIMKKNLELNGTLNPNTCEVIEQGNVTCDEVELEVEVDGEVPDSGTMIFDRGRVIGTSLIFGEKKVIIKQNGELVLVDKSFADPKSFAEDSWDTITKNVRIGNLSQYKVGDTKQVTLTGDLAGTYTVRIANTSTPSECSTEGFSQTACGFVIEFADIIINHVMNSTDTNEGGWEASEMRSYVNNEIYNAFPEELKKNIIDTYVVSGYESGKTENYKTTDKLYLLSTKEVYGKEGIELIIEDDSAEEETRQLDYYKSIGVTTDSYEGASKTEVWWLRSSNSRYTRSFYYVSASGDWSYSSADHTYGVAVAFRL